MAVETLMNLLISKLIPPHCLARHSSNKAVSWSLKQHPPCSIADIFHIWCANGFRFASHLGNLRLRGSDWLQVSFMGPLFLYFFQNFPNFSFRAAMSNPNGLLSKKLW